MILAPTNGNTVSTYTGGTTLNAGTLVAAKTQAMGTPGTPLNLNAGTLDLATDTSVVSYNTNVEGNVLIQSDKATAASIGITQSLAH